MVSQAKGIMYVPVWIDDGVVKALVTDDGYLPVTETTPITELDVTLKASDITLPVSEQSPLTNIQARVYTYYNGSWQVAPTETDGSLHVHLESYEGTLLVQQYMPSLLQPGMNAHIGGDWQKQPLIWGYEDRFYEDLDGVQSGVGTFVSTMSVVPADYAYVIQCVSMANISGARGRAHIKAYFGTEYVDLAYNLTPAIEEPIIFNGSVVLKPDDKIEIVQVSCLDADSIKAGVWGYKMPIGL